MSETPSSGVRVKSIHARQLFGMYDHDIVLKPERTTILFGRNGVGKTVMFKLTHAILSGDIAAMLDLLRYPYREFKVILSDGSEVVAVRKEREGNEQAHLSYLPATGGEATTFTINERVFTRLAARLERHLPFHQVGPDRWRDDETGEVMNALEVVSRWGELGDDEVSKDVAGWRKLVGSHLPQTLLIQAQRLIRIGRPSARTYLRQEGTAIRDTVLAYSADLKNRIDQTLAEYGREAQRRDQTYPQRLFQQASAPSGDGLMGQEEIIESLHALKRQQASYQALGILDEQTQGMALNEDQLLTDVYRAAMSVYVRDTQAKLKIVDNLAQRVRLLLDLMGEKFSNKALKIDTKTHDLVVESTHGKAQRLSVNALSSGEQHQLVLAYDLLFRTQPNTLVLLDEPELSLHVDWQERFLKDLKAVIDLVGFDALLATHSPYIINGHNELSVGLSVQVSADASR
jgi:predicted ATP-binding protein involved in virulence